MNNQIKSALIITYYKSDNYGAFLQTFALQEFLKSKGIDAYVYKYSYFKSYILKKLYRIIKHQKKKSDEEEYYHNKISNCILLEQERLNLTTKTNMDITIIGSDEVWNVKNISAPHNKFFFCKNKNSKKTISYAACSGNSNLKHFLFFPFAKKGIKHLDSVSVRDDATEKLVKRITSDEIYRVLDPTFLIDFDQFLQKCDYDDKYLFVYSYGLGKDDIKSIKSLANKENLKIVATGNYYDWADYNPTPNPFEWIYLIKNAEFIVTSTFHGTILSIQQNKNFAVCNCKSFKIKNALKETNLKNRVINQWNTLEKLYYQKINYNNVNSRIEVLVQASKNYILKNLNKSITEDNQDMVKVNEEEVEIYIARHKDQKVRWNSRSGGAFTAISDYVLSKNGVMYGASFNKQLEVEHIRAENFVMRDKMRGSKYVQSNMTQVLPLIKEDLMAGRYVLFTGTSCQVDAVYNLAKHINRLENLMTVDFICHGVPSPKIYKDYLNLFNDVESFIFRNKKKFGWGDHVETIKTKDKEIHSNAYTKLYHGEFITRPCCYECPYTSYERYSDITIADAWGVERIIPGFNDDDSGASLILVNTEKGKNIIQECLKAMEYKKISKKEIKQPVLEGKGKGVIDVPHDRYIFWKEYEKFGITYVIHKYSHNGLKDKLKMIIPHKVRFYIKKLLRKN